MVSSNQSFINRFAKGKVSSGSSQASRSFSNVQRTAGVSEATIKKQKRRSGRSSSSRTNVTTPIYNSALLNKSFNSKEALAKAEQTEKTKQLKQTQEAEVRTEFKKILDARDKIMSRGGRKDIRNSTQFETKDKLQVTQWRLSNGERVQKIKNFNKGTTTYSSFSRAYQGGSIRKTGEIVSSNGISNGISKPQSPKVKIVKSTTPGKLIVTFPNGRSATLNATGRGTVGKAFAGNRYTFLNGKVESINGNFVNKNRKVFEPVLSVEKRESAKGLEKTARDIRDLRGALNTARARGNIKSVSEGKLLAFAFVGALLEGGIAITKLPSTALAFFRNPSLIKQIPSQIAQSGEQFGILLQTSPSEAFGILAGEYVLLRGTSAGLKAVSKTSSKVLLRLNPKFTGKANIGSNLNIKTAPGRTVNLKVVGKIPKEKLLSQVNKQGRRLTAISSQADELIGFFKKTKTIRKPIPISPQANPKFKLLTKTLLKKFDKGTITKQELFDLDFLIRSQGSKGLLERSFFADPTGKVRPSRLGITNNKNAGVLDYLSGDITLRKAKPQILLFDDIRVSKFPNSLKTIQNKIKAGRKLTTAEANALLEWQLKQTGKFKPVGFISGESEITLAPKEILKKTKVVAITEVSGKRVPIVKVEVLQQTTTMKTLINKLDRGVITSIERTRLDKLLKKATGFNYGLSSSASVSARYVPIRRIGASILPQLSKLVSGKKTSKLKSKPRLVSKNGSPLRTYKSSSKSSSPRKSSSSKASSKKANSKSSSPRKSSSSKSPKSLSSPASPKSRSKTIKSSIIKPVIPKGFKRKVLTKKQEVFYVKLKRNKKIVNLTPRPLILKDAKDFLAYRIDNGLGRSAWFEPLGKAKVVVGLPRNMNGYFLKNSKKLRAFKIRVGKKKSIRNGYIERTKYIADRPIEKLQLKTSRRISTRKRATSKTSTTKKRVVRQPPTKRKSTTTIQKQRLLNLSKARAKLRQNRLKRK